MVVMVYLQIKGLFVNNEWQRTMLH